MRIQASLHTVVNLMVVKKRAPNITNTILARHSSPMIFRRCMKHRQYICTTLQQFWEMRASYATIRRLGLMRSFLSVWMPWQSNMGSRGRLSCSGDSNRSMFSMSGSGVSRCRLLHSLSAGLLVAGVGVPSSCSVTRDDFDLTSWLSPFSES